MDFPTKNGDFPWSDNDAFLNSWPSIGVAETRHLGTIPKNEASFQVFRCSEATIIYPDILGHKCIYIYPIIVYLFNQILNGIVIYLI